MRSLPIALQELKILNADETRAILEDAAATHRTGATLLENSGQHLAIAERIERITAHLTAVPAPRT